MTEIYVPRVHAPDDGTFADINIITLQEELFVNDVTHVRTTKNKVWKIFPELNKKSVPLNNGGDGPQRITFKTVESFGVMQETPEPTEELVDAVEQVQNEDGNPVNEQGITFGQHLQNPDREVGSWSPATHLPGGPGQPLPPAVEGEGEREAPATNTPAHEERAHAVLSASGAHRWMNCPPSALLEADLPDTTSDAADQGTAAHELAEHKLREALGVPTERPVSDWHDQEMAELTDQYRDDVLALLADARKTSPDAQLFIEQRVDFSHLVPGGFGTADCVIIADGTMYIIDLKYGAGVLVEAHGNPQGRIYALGALRMFDVLYDIEEVIITIYQPRRSNISSEHLTVDELTHWAETELRPAAEIAATGGGDFNAGDWCGFCKLKSTCRARAEKNLQIAQFEFEPPVDLTDDEIAEALRLIPEAKKWMADLEKYASAAAVDHGRQWPGFKLVAGRATRKWVDEDQVAQAAEAAGHTDVWSKKLIGIGAMEKLLGKDQFDDVLGDLVHKPEGRPTLVPEDDRRPPIDVHSAESDFAN